MTGLPEADSETGRVGPAPWQGYPNGGGARAYLFRYDAPDRPLRWRVSDTGNAQTFDGIPQIDADYLADEGVNLGRLEFVTAEGTPRQWLAEAVAGAASESVDLWLGYGNPAHVRQVLTLLRPRFFVPGHWDGYPNAPRSGATRPFRNPNLQAVLDAAGVVLLPQTRYLERYRLTPEGFTRVSG